MKILNGISTIVANKFLDKANAWFTKIPYVDIGMLISLMCVLVCVCVHVCVNVRMRFCQIIILHC